MTETYCDICGKKCVVKPYDMISGKEDGAVSYTHLDVYKRQHYISNNLIKGKKGSK